MNTPLRAHSPKTILTLGACLLALSPLGACRKQKPDPDPKALSVQAAPGAERWEGSALELPARAPMVITMRPDAIIGGVSDLYEWFIAEPAMLGPNDSGVVRARELVNLRATLQEALGMNPLALKDWAGFGIAMDRDALFGLYALTPSGESFVDMVESELGAQVGVKEDGDLLAAMELYEGDPVVGLYSKLAREGRKAVVSAGARLVLPLSDEARALDSLDRLAQSVELARVMPEASSSLKRIYFIDRPEDIPALGVRAERGHLLVDVVYLPRLEATGERERREEVAAQLESAIKQAGRGLPNAPRPLGEPAIAMSMDQQGISKLSRYSGYQSALSQSLNAAASERDGELLFQLDRAIRAGYAWDVGAKGLSGFTYELHLGGEHEGKARQLGLHMSIFGARELKLPAVSRISAGLGLGARSVGASFDPLLFTGEQWKQWLGVEHPERILSAFDVDASESASLGVFVLALPRNIALLVANFEEMLKAELPLDIIPLYAQRDKIAQLEMVLPDSNLSRFASAPRVVGLVRIKQGIAPIDRDVVSAALRDTLHELLDQSEMAVLTPPDEQADGAAGEQEYDRAEALTPGAITRFEAPSSDPLSGLYYYYQREGDAPFIVFGYGVDEQGMQREVERLKSTTPALTPAREVARLRAQPAGLVQLARAYDPSLMSFPLDLDILARRVGALLVHVESGANDERVIQYGFELMRPDQLD